MSSKASSTPEFTGWRAKFWPIHNFELKKFIPLGMIMFCLLFNYTVLRDTKDTLVVNSAGASAISFLKLYCVTPMAIAFVVVYAKISNMLSRENVFYAVVTPFLVFFGAFAFVIYPNLELLHPSEATIASMHQAYPALSGFIDIFAYWSFSLFYVMAEIWGSAMVALLFWQFANHIVRMTESKRFYGLFVVIGNLALILSGQVVRFCSESIKSFLPEGANEWQYSLYLLMGSVVIMGVFAMWLYRWMHTSVLTDPLYFDGDIHEQATSGKKKKKKPGLVESFKILVTSPELGLIAVLVMAYGVTINLAEVQWKHQLKIYFDGDKGAYNAFMGNFSTWTGVATIFFSLFVGSNVLRRLSWFKSAAITPLVILVGGGLFFLFIIAQDTMAGLLAAASTNAVVAATFMGAFIVIMSKAIKYSLFDPTKEMAYIPLDPELKSKGKAAVDVIGGRAGKAGGAFVQSTLLMAYMTKDVVTIAPISFVIFLVIGVAWIFAAKVLGTKVDAAVSRQNAEREKTEQENLESAEVVSEAKKDKETSAA